MKTFTKYFESADTDMVVLDKTYTTTLKDEYCDLEYISDMQDYECNGATIYWGIKMEDNPQGISNLRVVVTKVVCNVVGENLTAAGDPVDQPVDEELIIDKNNITNVIDFSDRVISGRFDIYPKFITVNYVNKTCEVLFN